MLVPAILLSIQHPVMAPGKAVEVCGCLHPWEAKEVINSWFQLAQPNCCAHLGSEPAGERSVSSCQSAFQISKSFKTQKTVSENLQLSNQYSIDQK